MSTEKRIQKVKKLLKAPDEPTIDAFNYRNSLLRFFNYHNANTSLSDMRKWAESHFQTINKKAPNLRDAEFRTLGILVRLALIDAYVEDDIPKKIDEETNRILQIVEKEPLEAKTEEKSNRSDLIEKSITSKASEFIGEFEGLVDEFLLTGTNQNISALITSLAVSSRVSPKIEEYARKKSEYYKSVVSDKEAMEYYSFSKPTLKKVGLMYEDLIDKLSQNKKIRAPRTRKEKPAGVLVKGLKYKISDDSLGLKSVSPTGIIGATEVYLYRVDQRKLQYFKAIEGSTLTVKGTTILNYDESKSFQKNIRKPEILKDFQGKGKLDSRRFFKDIKSTEQSVSGRSSDETLILSTLK